MTLFAFDAAGMDFIMVPVLIYIAVFMFIIGFAAAGIFAFITKRIRRKKNTSPNPDQTQQNEKEGEIDA